MEAAANGYFEGNLDKPDDPDDVPPPLPEMPRDEPPAYNPFGPQTYFDMSNPTPGGDSKRITTTPERSTAVTLYGEPSVLARADLELMRPLSQTLLRALLPS